MWPSASGSGGGANPIWGQDNPPQNPGWPSPSPGGGSNPSSGGWLGPGSNSGGGSNPPSGGWFGPNSGGGSQPTPGFPGPNPGGQSKPASGGWFGPGSNSGGGSNPTPGGWFGPGSNSGGGSNPTPGGWFGPGSNSGGGSNPTPGFPGPSPTPGFPGPSPTPGFPGGGSNPSGGGWQNPTPGGGSNPGPGWPGSGGGSHPTPSSKSSQITPCLLDLPNGLKDKLLLTISGRIKPNAKKFTIDLNTKNDIAFHFNPRFNDCGDRNAVIRNSCIRKKWGSEERTLQHFPFSPNQPFEIKILCTSAEYRVAVNNSHLLTFRHRITNLRDITKVGVYYDVENVTIKAETIS